MFQPSQMLLFATCSGTWSWSFASVFNVSYHWGGGSMRLGTTTFEIRFKMGLFWPYHWSWSMLLHWHGKWSLQPSSTTTICYATAYYIKIGILEASSASNNNDNKQLHFQLPYCTENDADGHKRNIYAIPLDEMRAAWRGFKFQWEWGNIMHTTT